MKPLFHFFATIHTGSYTIYKIIECVLLLIASFQNKNKNDQRYTTVGQKNGISILIS
jgi:hypothetical protein